MVGRKEEGEALGCELGNSVEGRLLGARVGGSVGTAVVGPSVGEDVGSWLGAALGILVPVGSTEGCALTEGAAVEDPGEPHS